MIHQKKVLAIIPARGGSKGLPGKNSKLLKGLPLVAWPIKNALQSKYIDRVIVSTDDAGIASLALEHGAEVPFLRPAELAMDTSPSSEAIIHAIEFCTQEQGEYHYVVLLEPTSPLTQSSDVDKALERLVTSEGLSIVSVSKVEATHPAFCATLGKDQFLKAWNGDSFTQPTRRQDLDELYYFDGSLYISEIANYLKTRTFYHARTLAYEVPAWKAMEVDTLLDFLKIETVLNHQELLNITPLNGVIMQENDFTSRLLKVIPGGAHTYSRGYDQYPENAPPIMERGKGAYSFDEKNQNYLDYGMALRAVSIGYAEDEIDQAAFEQIRKGNNLTRPSLIELEAAELFVSLIDSVDMVKFTKNGSTAVSAAVKLARAYTGRTLIARCVDQPFFSYDDWFIGSTPIKRGIPENVIEQTKLFAYNDLSSLSVLIEQYPDQIACVVLEASSLEHPAPSKDIIGETYLHDVQRLCNKHGIVLILDEMITGFRWHLKGAQHYYNIQPDLCTFGKAMANGFSVAAVAGKREIMELGSIEKPGLERLFLLSTTHGAEMCGLGAFVKTMEFMQKHKVVNHLWDYGKKLIALMNQQASLAGIGDFFKAGGIDCSPWYIAYDHTAEVSLPFRTLFSQEMIKQGVLMPWIALSFRHGDLELEKTSVALEKAFKVYAAALKQGSTDGYLKGAAIKPVFRPIN